jgi:hypothetical protein
MTDERQTEIDCIAKFRARADKLVAANPLLSREIALAKACEQMPNTMARYLRARSVLGLRGVAGLRLE